MQCCARCGRKVYCAELKTALNKIWHTFCFSCYNCKKLLNNSSFRTVNGEIFCNCCYNYLFKHSDSSKLLYQPFDYCKSVLLQSTSMPNFCCSKPKITCLKTPCPRTTCNGMCSSTEDDAPSPCMTRCKISSPGCYHKRCCSPCRDPCVTSVPRETANYYSRNHGQAPDLICKNRCCSFKCQEPSSCCRCTTMECCPPKTCCSRKITRNCQPRRRCCSPKSCCVLNSCDPCLTKCVAESSCSPFSAPCRRIYYPPIKCCEPCPPEIICLEPSNIDHEHNCNCIAPNHCCCRCNQKTVTICDDNSYCQRCDQKVYAAEKIPVSGGAFHTSCITCYCCGKQLEVTNFYEHCGEIYCKVCYRKLLGVECYGI